MLIHFGLTRCRPRDCPKHEESKSLDRGCQHNSSSFFPILTPAALLTQKCNFVPPLEGNLEVKNKSTLVCYIWGECGVKCLAQGWLLKPPRLWPQPGAVQVYPHPSWGGGVRDTLQLFRKRRKCQVEYLKQCCAFEGQPAHATPMVNKLQRKMSLLRNIYNDKKSLHKVLQRCIHSFLKNHGIQNDTKYLLWKELCPFRKSMSFLCLYLLASIHVSCFHFTFN